VTEFSNHQDNLAQSQVREFKDIFKFFDADKDDKLNSNDLKTVLHTKLGLMWDDKTIKQMMEEGNRSSSQPFGFGEFLQILGVKLKNTASPIALLKAFKSFDPEGNGYILASDFKKALQDYAAMTDSEWNSMVQENGGTQELFYYQALVDKMTSTDSTKKKATQEDDDIIE
jgi:calmodulin